MNINFENSTKIPIKTDGLEKVFKRAAKLLKLPKETCVNVFFVSSAEIKKLNKKTRRLDAVTDVLSFPLFEKRPFKKGADGNVCLGDVVIDPEYSLKNAEKEGREKNGEVKFLFVHGLLHLCGYDHATEKEQRVMDVASEKILNNKKND